MAKIVITNINQLRNLANKFRAVSKTLPTLQRNSLEAAATEIILKSIHTDMETNEFSPKIIEKTRVGPIQVLDGGKKARIHFISDYVSDSGFDVSEGREEGTRDHDVIAPPGKWLRFIDPETNKPVYRKKTHPSGIQRLLIIETNILKGEQKFLDNYSNNVTSAIAQTVVI